VTQSVLSPPRWYRADDGRFHLQYELELTNAVSMPVGVTSLQVLGANGWRIKTLSGGGLAAAMSLLATPEEPTTELPASTVGIVWLDLSFAHRGRFPAGSSIGPPSTSAWACRSGRPSRTPMARRRSPRSRCARSARRLVGGRWVTVVGAHRRSLQPVNGALRDGQRFAIDFAALLDAGGRTHTGDPSQNSSYFNYGWPVLAVAAGKVVEAVDRYPDQIPNQEVPVTGAALDGNHVISQARPRGCLPPTRTRCRGASGVHRGERVRDGQVLGRLGNSGASSGPHPHRRRRLGAPGPTGAHRSLRPRQLPPPRTERTRRGHAAARMSPLPASLQPPRADPLDGEASPGRVARATPP
jgi:hypothetical protein